MTDSKDLVPVDRTSEETDEKKLRVKVALIIDQAVADRDRQAGTELLARVDRAIYAAALANGTTGQEMNDAYVAGLKCFISEKRGQDADA